MTNDTRRQRALITGGAAGLGLQTARGLARAGFDLILADRNSGAGEAAQLTLAAEFPALTIDFRELDLGNLAAIADFADRLGKESAPLDRLINNAGIFPPHQHRETSDGLELCFGVGFLGHFALTAALLPSLLRAEAPRVISVTSIAHAHARLPLDAPDSTASYDATRAYAATKLACLVFAQELQRRADAADLNLLSLAAHPGIARTRIGQHANNPAQRLRDRLVELATRIAMGWFGQSAAQGAEPILGAALWPELRGGELLGPTGFCQWRGAPGIVSPHQRTLARADADALWQLAERGTGVDFRCQSESSHPGHKHA